jgi:hypothetical protein
MAPWALLIRELYPRIEAHHSEALIRVCGAVCIGLVAAFVAFGVSMYGIQ